MHAKIVVVTFLLLLSVNAGTAVNAHSPVVLNNYNQDTVNHVTGQLLPTEKNRQTAAGWRKYEKNPVLGGKLGTCFDVSVLKEKNTYRMYFSWRPKESIALVESPDGIHWNEPVIILTPNPGSGWEDRVNRPVVVRRRDGYHMWYTGQSQDPL